MGFLASLYLKRKLLAYLFIYVPIHLQKELE